MTPEENMKISRVAPGTPCGEMMRRYWIPVGPSHELNVLPKLVRVLGEDLVLFRDGHGKIGLLGKHCSHRGTSLEFGQVDEDGIRCCYHGWLYDVEGRVLDTPAEPPESRFKDSIRHLAYPCRELGGVIFAYLGPREKMPELPGYDFLVLEDGTREIRRWSLDCNWLQALENVGDPVHTSILHRIPEKGQFSERHNSELPMFDLERTDSGIKVTQIRSQWKSQERLILPMLQIVPGKLYGRDEDPPPGDVECSSQATWKIPVDDTHTLRFMVVFTPNDRDGRPRRLPGGAQGDTSTSYEEAQLDPRDTYSQVSQGDIARREDWHLATADKGVVMWEDMVLEGTRAVEEGRDPPGIIRDPDKARFVDVYPFIRFEPSANEPWRIGQSIWGKRLASTRPR